MKHRGALVEYANGIVDNRAQAEDLVQEAWLRFDKATRQRPLEQPVGYLYRIVRNLALDNRRRMRREAQVVAAGAYEAASGTHSDDASSPEQVALYKDQLELVMEAIEELPERTRIALEMHRFGGYTLSEIAARLNGVPGHIRGPRPCSGRRGRTALQAPSWLALAPQSMQHLETAVPHAFSV